MIKFILVFLSFVNAFHSSIGQTCLVDLDCVSADGWELCGENGKCIHKALWPMKEMEFWGMIAVILCLLFANTGGVGGGGMLVPIGICFFMFDPKNAIALSNFSIFLSSFIRYILNSGKSHPLKNGKGILVDLNLGIIMLPMIISGVSCGSILNIMAPQILVIFFYIILLAYIGINLSIKAVSLFKKERD